MRPKCWNCGAQRRAERLVLRRVLFRPRLDVLRPRLAVFRRRLALFPAPVRFLAVLFRVDFRRVVLLRADLRAPRALFFAVLFRPPFDALLRLLFFLALRFLPDPDLRPPPLCLFTVAHARRSASSSETPRSL